MRRPPGYWRVAGIYACAFAAVALTFPFMNPYLLDLGFSGVQIGNLLAISSLLSMILTPVISSLADRTGRHRRLLWGVMALEIGALGLLSLPSVLVAVGAGSVLSRVGLRLDVTLRDRLTLHWIGEHEHTAYGGLRLWGSLGYALVGLFSGALAEAVGLGWLFAGAGVMVLVMLVLSRVYAPQLAVDRHPAGGSPARRNGFRVRLPRLHWPDTLSGAMVVIMVTVFVAALGQSCYFGWNYAFIENDLGGGKSAVGLYGALAALVEAPFMLLADRWLRRRGAALLWGVGLLFWGAGWLLMSGVQTAAQVMLIALPAGIAQGFVIVSPVVYVGQMSKPYNTALNLALMGVSASVGLMIGSVVAGWVFDTAGMRVLLRLGTVLITLAAGTLWTGTFWLRWRETVLRPVM